MIQKKFAAFVVVSAVCAVTLILSSFAPAGGGFTDCFIQKSKEWGKGTWDEGRLTVTLENTCEEEQDVQIAIKKKDNSWSAGIGKGIGFRKTYTYATSSASNEIKWLSRKANDYSVNFPSESQIRAAQ